MHLYIYQFHLNNRFVEFDKLLRNYIMAKLSVELPFDS